MNINKHINSVNLVPGLEGIYSTRTSNLTVKNTTRLTKAKMKDNLDFICIVIDLSINSFFLRKTLELLNNLIIFILNAEKPKSKK